MKILYISDSYTQKGNSAAIRNNALVKGLEELGHEVDVLTVKYPERVVSPYLNNGNVRCYELWNWGARDSIAAVAQRHKVVDFFKAKYRRIRRVIVFPDLCYKWPTKVNTKELKNYDLMISSSDNKSSHFVGMKIKKANRKLNWVQIWGDPWSSDVNTIWADRIRIPLYEKRLLRMADHVVYISEPTANEIITRYPKFRDKIHFIPRSYFEAHEYIVPAGGDLHIVYTGSIRGVYGRKIDDFVKVVGQYNLTHKQRIILDFYGEVSETVVNELKSDFVVFHEGVDISELGAIYRKSNALLYVANKSGSTQIPGKLYDYLGTSSLILCLMSGDSDLTYSFLKTLEPRCLLVNNNYESINNEIGYIVEMMRHSYSVNQMFSPKNIANQLIKLL